MFSKNRNINTGSQLGLLYMEYLQKSDDNGKEQPYGLQIRNSAKQLNRHGSLPAQKSDRLARLIEVKDSNRPGLKTNLRVSDMYTKQTNKPYFFRQQFHQRSEQAPTLN